MRTHAHIADLITEAALPPRVTERALAVFRRLAEVESALHRVPVDQVHFHEVGGHDAIIDIVGTVAALEVLDVDEITASPVATGTGMVRSAHGLLPNPSPAAVRLLEGVPTYGRATTVELTTPTGAALLAALSTSFGPMPAMVVRRSGFGAGKNEMDELPNCTQVIIGQYDERPSIGAGQPAWVLETNLDDVTGEQLAYAVSAALDAGAFDAWVSSVIMKKGRPGHVLHVLTDTRAPRPLAPRHADRDRHLRGAGHRRRALARRPFVRRGVGRRHGGAHEGGARAGQTRIRRRGAHRVDDRGRGA